MATGRQPAFGRRPAPRAAVPAPLAARGIPESGTSVVTVQPEPDAELESWKRGRRWQPPWRQIALMASLCFGIGSLVLPDSVSEVLHWLLYALTGASLYAGWRGPRLRPGSPNR
jgi:hypothetical protein